MAGVVSGKPVPFIETTARQGYMVPLGGEEREVRNRNCN